MRVKIVVWIVLMLLCVICPFTYMTIQEDFRDAEVGVPARIIVFVIVMLPSQSLIPLHVWSMKKRGESFDLLTEWYR